MVLRKESRIKPLIYETKMNKDCLLCFLTSKRVLCMPFAGWNNFLGAKTGFSVSFCHKWEKITRKHVIKVYQHLGVTLKRWLTPKSWLTPGENVAKWAELTCVYYHYLWLVILCHFCAFFSFFFLFSVSDRNKISHRNKWFLPQTACEAPVRWSKYTTRDYNTNNIF